MILLRERFLKHAYREYIFIPSSFKKKSTYSSTSALSVCLQYFTLRLLCFSGRKMYTIKYYKEKEIKLLN